MMKKLALTLVFGILGVGVYGQTIKSLGYNTTNGQVVYSGTNTLAFTNETIKFQRVGEPDYITISEGRTIGYFLSENYINLEEMTFSPRISVYDGTNSLEISAVAAQTRTNLALGATWLTNTNVTNFRTAIGLGATDGVVFAAGLTNNVGIGVESTNTGLASGGAIQGGLGLVQNGNLVARFDSFDGIRVYRQIKFDSGSAETRTNLGLGGGITTNRTFVSYDGTNYTTNSVTISNGIITGWTQ
jgi:hypothetical protein